MSETNLDLSPLVLEIEAVMSTYIPDFGRKFSLDFTTAAIDEVREEKVFAIRTARALVFGETGVGKTTTINFLLNNPIFPTSGELSCTRSLACGEHAGGLIFYDSPGLGDEGGLENVTRAALGIERLADEPIEGVTLLDLTANNAEGPLDFVTLPYDAFADEISAAFYQAHQTRIVAKRFDLADFEQWAAANFDFFVFVTSSNRGLPAPIAKTLQAFDRRGKILFKVFNVFGGNYRPDPANLDTTIRPKYEQALERSAKYQLSQAGQWLLIDSRTGDGVAALIKAFAEALPVDVLRSLNRVVKEQYAHLIVNKIDSFFFDYTGHIAALLAVFPVDHAEQDRRFLKFALDSLVTMARFMFAGRDDGRDDLFGGQLVEEMIDELEFSKKRTKITHEVARTKKDSFLLKIVDRMGKRVSADFDAFKTFDAYETVAQPVEGETYFAVGGVDAVQQILGLGLTLHALYRQPVQPDLSTNELLSLFEANRRHIEAEMGYRLRGKLIEVTRLAAQRSTPAEKREMAETLFPHIRVLLTPETTS